MSKIKITKLESFRDLVLKEYEKGNIVVMGAEGLQTAPLKEIIEQPISGLLYDLNRDETVILTFIEDRKWVNDFAVCKVIRELKRQVEELTVHKTKECSSIKSKDGKHHRVSSDPEGNYCGNCGQDLDEKLE